MIFYNEYSLLECLVCAIMILEFFQPSTSKMILQEIKEINSNTTSEVVVYNSLIWDNKDALDSVFINKEGENNKIPIFRLDQPIGAFNPCSADSFSNDIIKPLLSDTLENNGMKYTNVTEKWFALVDLVTVSEHCTVQPIHLFYAPYLALCAQSVGASGIIWVHNGQPALAKSIGMPPYVNKNMQTVKGEKITIPALVTKSTDAVDFYSMKSYQWAIKSVSIDVNPFDPIHNPFSAYAMLYMLIGVVSFMMGLFIIYHIKSVIRFYWYEQRNKAASKVALAMRLLILIPEFLNAGVRTLTAVDPLGVLFRINYFDARMLSSMFLALSTFTDVIMIVYCSDVYQIFKASRVLRPATPFIVKYKHGIYLIFFLALVMLISDQMVLYLSLIGRLGSANLVVPMLYMICVNTTVTATLLTICKRMKYEVSASLKKLRKVLAPHTPVLVVGDGVTTTSKPETQKVKKEISSLATQQTQNIIDKAESLLRMRSFMQIAAFSRLFTIFGILSIGLALHKVSYLSYMIIMSDIGISITISSLAQILAALQLPHSSNRGPAVAPSGPKFQRQIAFINSKFTKDEAICD